MKVASIVPFCMTVLAAACGGTDRAASMPSAPTPPVAAPPAPSPLPRPTITVTATGVLPAEVTVTVGSRVSFVNADSRAHDMLGGPDHNRPDCPEVDVVGFLAPGQGRDTRVFESARTCEFHDHTNLGNPAFQGRIVVR